MPVVEKTFADPARNASPPPPEPFLPGRVLSYREGTSAPAVRVTLAAGGHTAFYSFRPGSKIRCGGFGFQGREHTQRSGRGKLAERRMYGSPHHPKERAGLKQWKVVVTDYIENDLDWEVSEFGKLPNVTFEYYQLKQAPKAELIEKIKDADIVVVNMATFDPEVIGSLEKCVLLIRHGIGYDNVNVPACTENRIRFAYQPDYCATEVAEQTVALIMCCARKLFASLEVLHDAAERQIWNFAPMGEVHRLFGQTLGLIGCGRIGGRVTRIMKALGMKVMVCDPYIDERQKGALGIDEVYDFETVLREADIITLHTPLTDETRYMIDEPQLKMMKQSAILINTARGGLVRTEALAKALREGWIAGAGIDVYEKEPPPTDMPLFSAPNATLSAHIGWLSVEAGWDIRYKIMDDIKACLDGRPPKNTVNKELDALLGGKVYREV